MKPDKYIPAEILAREVQYVAAARGLWSRLWRSARAAWRCARLARAARKAVRHTVTLSFLVVCLAASSAAWAQGGDDWNRDALRHGRGGDATEAERQLRAEMGAISLALTDDQSFTSHAATVAIHTALDAAVASWVAGSKSRSITVDVWGRAVTLAWPWATGKALAQPSARDLVSTLQSQQQLFGSLREVPIDVSILVWHRLAKYARVQQLRSDGPQEIVWARLATGARVMRDYARTMKAAGRRILSVIPEDDLYTFARAYLGL